MDDINKIRIEIDDIDSKIFKLLDDRFALVEDIGKYKNEYNISIEQLGREEVINDKIIRECIYKNNIKNIYQLIYKESKKIQK